jgi:hypothetical protein
VEEEVEVEVWESGKEKYISILQPGINHNDSNSDGPKGHAVSTPGYSRFFWFIGPETLGNDFGTSVRFPTSTEMQ